MRSFSSWRLTSLPSAAALLVMGMGLAPAARPATHFLVIEGLGGTRDYAERYREQVVALLPALRRMANGDTQVRVVAGAQATRERIETQFGELARKVAPGDSLAVFLLGHGSHDGQTYKFNIPGPDVTDRQLKRWLDAVPAARQLVVSTTSSSGGALEVLKGPRRIVITATRNGRERNATVFGTYWAEALSASEADTDKNETISALEAFRYAESKVKAHFEDAKQLATEHPQLQGERADGFLLARLGRAAELAGDPSMRALLLQREALERRIADLVARKDDTPENEYLDALQALLLELAELQSRIDPGGGLPDRGMP